jgi:hypothetical protein
MDNGILKRLAATSETGDLAAAAQILTETKDDKDYYSVCFAALSAASTYGSRQGFEVAMNKIANMQVLSSDTPSQ